MKPIAFSTLLQCTIHTVADWMEVMSSCDGSQFMILYVTLSGQNMVLQGIIPEQLKLSDEKVGLRFPVLDFTHIIAFR